MRSVHANNVESDTKEPKNFLKAQRTLPRNSRQTSSVQGNPNLEGDGVNVYQPSRTYKQDKWGKQARGGDLYKLGRSPPEMNQRIKLPRVQCDEQQLARTGRVLKIASDPYDVEF